MFTGQEAVGRDGYDWLAGFGESRVRTCYHAGLLTNAEHWEALAYLYVSEMTATLHDPSREEIRRAVQLVTGRDDVDTSRAVWTLLDRVYEGREPATGSAPARHVVVAWGEPDATGMTPVTISLR